ncbi:MAG TPA: glycoside hydrolase family 2 TIM barrel-domain containing protein, partial [Verrucomicrobiae bacterium]
LPLARGEAIIEDVFARHLTSLNGKWNIIVDPYDTGYFDYRRQAYDAGGKVNGGYALDRKPKNAADLVEYDFDTSPTLNVPGDWNSQDDKLFYYEGTVWYRRKFTAPSLAAGHRLFVYFAGANYESDVYLNGHKLGKHIGGFTPFAYEITKWIHPGDNSLVVRVNNNRHAEAVPTVNTDWWNYGGITRDVLLVETPETYLANFRTRLKPGTTNVIEASAQLDGPAAPKVTFHFPALNLTAEAKPDSQGNFKTELQVSHLPLWSPTHPALTEVVVTAGEDQLTDRVGFRTISTRGQDILLNGEKVFLRGICIHEEVPTEGRRAWSEADARLLLGWAHDLGCNFVRLAHYPHNEHMARVADELGIMCWEEIPVYWTIQWTNSETLANARRQLSDEIARDQNRASVIIWSVANETPVGEARTRFLKTLIDDAHNLDGTRLVSAAMEVHTGSMENHPGQKPTDHKVVDDPLGAYTDLCSFNQYAGWYDGNLDKIDRLEWTIKWPKPVFISEFGADALQGRHADLDTIFGEEYQAELYRRTVRMLDRIPGFSGCTPWILADFRSPRRVLPVVQEGWNRKGLIGSNGKKKLAFEVLANYYQGKAAAEKSASPAP